MGSIGDVFVGIRFDATAFSAGVAAAQQQAAKLGQQLDMFRSPMEAAAAASRRTGVELENVGESSRTAAGHFELNNRVLARFASIGVQEVIPSLQGSRLALENLFQPVLRLGTGFGSLALAGIGVAGAIGYGVYRAFKDTEVVWKDAHGNVMSLEERYRALGKEIESSLDWLNRWNTATARGPAGAAGDKLGDLSLDLLGSQESGQGFAAGKAGKRVTALKDQERLTKAALALGDFSEAGGLQAGITQNTKLMADNFNRLSSTLDGLQRGFAHLAETDPLKKMLEADWEVISRFGLEVERLMAVGEVATDKGAALLERAYGLGNQRRETLRDTFNKQQGAGAEAALGFGDTGILAGLDAIEKLNRETEIYQGNIKRMVEAKVGQRDIENEIQRAQTKVDATMADLNKRFADTPAVLDLMKTSFTKLEFGQFARNLDATAAGLGLTSKASYGVTEAMGAIPSAMDAAGLSMVYTTADAYDLARALHAVFVEGTLARSVVGRSANLGAAAAAQ